MERPGSTAASTVSIVPATIRPAIRIFSISSGDFRMIIGTRSRTPSVRSIDLVGQRLGVDLVEEVPFGVEPLERRRLAPGRRPAASEP